MFRPMLAMAGMALVVLLTVAPAADRRNAVQNFTADDYIQIQQLYATYAQALDKGEGEQFSSTFVEDGEFTGGRGAGRGAEVRSPTKGREALTKMGSNGGTRHFTANLLITPTADGAKGSCYLLLFNVRTTPAAIVETAIYDDTLVKTAGGWKFQKRVVWRDDDDITPYRPKPLPAQSQEK